MSWFTRKSTKKNFNGKKLIFAMFFSSLILILLFFSIQFYISSFSRKYCITVENAPVSDAVLVLGALVYDDNTVSPVLKDRLDYAHALYNSGKVKKFLLSGDHGTKDYDEVNAMSNYLLSRGIPPEDIFMDHGGFNTYDSLYRAKHVFLVNSLIISTQNFHMGRSLYIGRKLGIDAYGYPSLDKAMYNMPYLYFRESLARIKAVFDTEIIKRKSKFLGPQMPIWGNGEVTKG